MLAKTFVLLASAALAVAGPLKGRADLAAANCPPKGPGATPTLPLTGGGTCRLLTCSASSSELSG